MNHLLVICLLLCLRYAAVFAGIAYELSVSFDDVKTEKMLVCTGQRPADAVADFLIQNGHHKDMVPTDSLFQQVFGKTCADTGLCDSASKGSEATPSRIVCKSDASIDVFWTHKESDKTNVIIREGYNGSGIADCVCSKVTCSEGEIIHLAAMVSQEIQKRVDLQAAEAVAQEKAQFESTNHYVVLGLLTEDAAAKGDADLTSISESSIKRAYLDLARRFHPDKHSGAMVEWATERFKRIAAAYEALSSPSVRAEYDRSVSPQRHQPQHQGGGMFFNFGGVHIHIPANGHFMFVFN